jgi:DNA-binding NtrC family response regulator
MGEKVLVVDDEPVLLQVLGRILGQAGFGVSLAQSGEQALAMLDEQDFDAALVDKNLLGIDGVEVMRHVRKRQPQCACVIMTGYPSTSSAIEALRLGVHDYVEKPSPELDVIADRLRESIQSARLQSERDILSCKLQLLEQELESKEHLLAQHAIEMAMSSELVDVRVAEQVAAVRRGVRERDLLLVESARRLLASARGLLDKKLLKLTAEIEAHLALLEAR